MGGGHGNPSKGVRQCASAGAACLGSAPDAASVGELNASRPTIRAGARVREPGRWT